MMITIKNILLCFSALFLAKWAVDEALTDRSVHFVAEGLWWKGVGYHYVGMLDLPRDKHFLASDDSGENIYGFGDDPEHTYVMKDSFLDQYLNVRNDYKIDRNSEITAIYKQNKPIPVTKENKQLKFALSYASMVKSQQCVISKGRELTRITLSYNKSLVGDDILGFITQQQGQWFYIAKLSKQESKSLYAAQPTQVSCVKVDAKYHAVLEGI